jgi:hypothetical protein
MLPEIDRQMLSKLGVASEIHQTSIIKLITELTQSSENLSPPQPAKPIASQSRPSMPVYRQEPLAQKLPQPPATVVSVNTNPLQAAIDTMQSILQQMTGERIAADTPLLGVKINSVQLMQFAQRTGKALDMRILPTLIVEYQTMAALAQAVTPQSGQAVQVTHQVQSKALTGLDNPSQLGDFAPDFSLMFFGNDVDNASEAYNLVLETATLGDEKGFKAIWVPERHFQVFGGNFPNPIPLVAALAMHTSTIRLRGGSVNSPQHATPLRIAEDWCVVDNLSNGRVDISFGAGWNPVDFALQPQNFLINKVVMWESLRAVRTLWQGGAVQVPDGAGRLIELKTRPRPQQECLEAWISCFINPQTFWDAGATG